MIKAFMITSSGLVYPGVVLRIRPSSCLRYLQPIMPVDRMYLQLCEMDLGAMRGIARATAEKGEKPRGRVRSDISSRDPGMLLLDRVVRRHVQAVLDSTGGRIHGPGGAAELMGINPSTLRNRMNKLGIPYGRKK